MIPKTLADLQLKFGPGEFQWWEGGNSGKWYLHWLGARLWYLVAVAIDEEHKDKLIECLKLP